MVQIKKIVPLNHKIIDFNEKVDVDMILNELKEPFDSFIVCMQEKVGQAEEGDGKEFPGFEDYICPIRGEFPDYPVRIINIEGSIEKQWYEKAELEQSISKCGKRSPLTKKELKSIYSVKDEFYLKKLEKTLDFIGSFLKNKEFEVAVKLTIFAEEILSQISYLPQEEAFNFRLDQIRLELDQYNTGKFEETWVNFDACFEQKDYQQAAEFLDLAATTLSKIKNYQSDNKGKLELQKSIEHFKLIVGFKLSKPDSFLSVKRTEIIGGYLKKVHLDEKQRYSLESALVKKLRNLYKIWKDEAIITPVNLGAERAEIEKTSLDIRYKTRLIRRLYEEGKAALTGDLIAKERDRILSIKLKGIQDKTWSKGASLRELYVATGSKFTNDELYAEIDLILSEEGLDVKLDPLKALYALCKERGFVDYKKIALSILTKVNAENRQKFLFHFYEKFGIKKFKDILDLEQDKDKFSLAEKVELCKVFIQDNNSKLDFADINLNKQGNLSVLLEVLNSIKNIQSLNLNNCSIEDAVLLQIINVLKSRVTIQELDLANNTIRNGGAKNTLIPIIKDGALLISELNLRGNPITDSWFSKDESGCYGRKNTLKRVCRNSGININI